MKKKIKQINTALDEIAKILEDGLDYYQFDYYQFDYDIPKSVVRDALDVAQGKEKGSWRDEIFKK